MGEFPSRKDQFVKGSERVKALGVMAGSVRSPRKKLASFIRNMERWGTSEATALKALALIHSSEMSAADWYRNIERLDELTKENPKLNLLVSQQKALWYREIHGKSNAPQINVQANSTAPIQINIITPNHDGNKLETE